ncbi:6-aminohexanoate-dimer hydrolase [bacterium YEK0313]|nr:6-aminohexanoate-dimer hydrolase [bacterium YEK0313]
MRHHVRPALGLAAGLIACGLAPAFAQTAPTFPSAADSDPNRLGIMRGFPPPADRTVRFGDGSGYRFPATRWAFSHMRELVPTATVWRGDAGAAALPRAERDLGTVRLTTLGGASMTFAEALAGTYTDGILVMHRGQVVYERYFGALAAHRPHIGMSLTKSFVGTLAAVLVAEGKLDPNAQVTRYVPELANTAYADATVRQVMDMTIGVRYSENYADPNAEVWAYARAGGMLPAGPNYQGPRSFYAFLTGLTKEGQHGEAFAYKTVNAEVLAWIVKRVSELSLADLLSDRIWSKLGAEEDAYFTVDSVGTESGGGGLNTTLRDLARFGEMMRNRGRFNGRQVIPAAVVEDIERGADRAHFAKAGYATLPSWSYRNMWWVSHNEHGAYMARGIHGQSVYVDPKAEMVIVRYASHPVAGNAFNDPITLPAYMAVAKALMQP